MKWMWSAVVALSVLVTLFGASMMGEAATKWMDLLKGLIPWLEPSVRFAFGLAGDLVLLAAIVVATGWAILTLFRLSWLAIVLMPGLATSIKRIIGMSEFLNEREALSRIRQSVFFRMRQKIDEYSGLGMGHALRSALQIGLPFREQVIRDRFAKKVLREFASVDGAYVEEKGFRSSRLDEWLEALIDAEVDDEMGQLPNAYLPPFKEDGQ